jgi:hypothetical protein
MYTEDRVKLGVRLKFETHGDRSESFATAVDHFEKTFQEGWRLVFVEEELDTGGHENMDRIPENDCWDCRYDAIGYMKEEV